MAITTQEQQNIIGLTVGLFNAAPGAQYLAELTEVYEANGNSLEALVNFILTTDAFNAQYASAQNDEEVIAIAVETFGVEPGTEAFDEASAFFANGLAAGRTAADLLVEAANYLSGDVDPQFADIAAQFQNKVEVATHFSVARSDIEELDVAALKAVVANVTADEASVQAAIDAVTAEYGEAPEEPTDPSDLTEALLALQAANDARDTFLIEEALQNELVQAVLGEDDVEEYLSDLEENGSLSDAQLTAIADAVNGEVDGEGENALDQAELDAEQALADSNDFVDAAVGALDNYLDAGFTARNNTPDVGTFDSASRTIQDTLIAESEAAFNEINGALENAVGGITGLSGRIATLQTRKAEFEAALEEQFVAEEAYENQALAFAATTDASYTAESGEVPAVSGDDVAELDNGTWVATAAGADLTGIDTLLAALQAQTDARGASDTAKERFETALDRVVEAETAGTDGVEDVAADAVVTANGYNDEVVPAEEVTITLSLDEIDAPLSQALIDLREGQAALTDALADLTEARELSDQLDTLDDGIVEAQNVFEDAFGLDLQFIAEGDLTGEAGDDLFLFASDVDNFADGEEIEINLFGEQGQDHIFFGNTEYQLVELTGDQTIDARVGSATELEIFWKQNGANLELFVENEAAAGTDTGNAAELQLTKVVVTEFNAEDIFAFENGLLSTAPVEVA